MKAWHSLDGPSRSPAGRSWQVVRDLLELLGAGMALLLALGVLGFLLWRIFATAVLLSH